MEKLTEVKRSELVSCDIKSRETKKENREKLKSNQNDGHEAHNKLKSMSKSKKIIMTNDFPSFLTVNLSVLFRISSLELRCLPPSNKALKSTEKIST